MMPENNDTLHLTVVGIEECRRAQELKRRLRSAARDAGILIEIQAFSLKSRKPTTCWIRCATHCSACLVC